MRRNNALKFKHCPPVPGESEREMDLPFPGLDSPPYTPPSVHEEIEVHHEDGEKTIYLTLTDQLNRLTLLSSDRQ